MRYLSGSEELRAKFFMQEAAKEALKSPCYRSKCGSVIEQNGIILGRGFNSPPRNKTIDHCFKDDLPDDFKSDKTCCVHSEQRADADLLKNNSDRLGEGSLTLFFLRLDAEGNMLYAGDPYCTMCSKFTYDIGVDYFVLWHDDGICVYDTEDYNRRSFAFRKTSSDVIVPKPPQSWLDRE